MIKKVLKIVLGLVLLIVILAGGFASYVAIDGIPSYKTQVVDLKVEVTPERVARGKVISNMMCGQCHLNTKTGRFTGHQLPDLPPQFGVAFSRNITQDKDVGIGSWTDGEIAFMLRTGINRRGKYTPPWMPKFPRIADEEIASIIAFLRSGDSLVQADPSPDFDSKVTFLTKFLTHVAFKPHPYPTTPIKAPDTSNLVAYGRYLALDAFDCYGCHSGDFKKMNDREPEKSFLFFGGGNSMPGVDSVPVNTANLTPDPTTGIGKWSEADFIKTVRDGVRPDGRLLRYPMVRIPEFSETDLKAIYAYLKTVPPIQHEVARNFPEMGGASLADGEAIYKKYGCIGCHGKTGVGVGDLTLAKNNLPTDSLLKAWIMNPPSMKPLTKMPPFQGVIKEEEFAPLMAYVRQLGK